MQITVLGDPQALKRHRTFRRGNFVGTYDPSQGVKKDFLSIVQEQAPEKPFDVALKVTMKFYFSRPKNHYRTGKYSGELKPNAPRWHIKRPDIDNLVKFVADALNKVFWRDDSIIAVMEVSKEYSEKPRTEILIEEIKEKEK